MRERTAATITLTFIALLLGVRAIAWAQSPILVMNPSGVTSGQSAAGQITLSTPAPAGGLVVQLSSSNPTVVIVPATAIVQAGTTTSGFLVTTGAVARATTVVITVTAAGLSNTGRLTVTPPGPSSVRLTQSMVGGSDSIAQLNLSGAAPAGGLAVQLSSSNPAVATVPATIMVAEGRLNATFTVTSTPVAQPAAITITAAVGATSASALLTVTPPTLADMHRATVDPSYGGGNVAISLRLSGSAPAAGYAVQLTSSNPAVASVPANHNFPAGTGKSGFNVSTVPVAQTTFVTITGTGGGVTKTVNVMVLPASIEAFTLSPGSVIGGHSATAQLTLTGPAHAGGVPFEISINGPPGVSAPTGFVVVAGQTGKSFTITTPPVGQSVSTTITATRVSAGTGAQIMRSAVLTILPPAPTSFTLTPNTISTTLGTAVSTTGRLVLSDPAPPGGLVVQLSSSHNGVQVPPQVTVPGGQSTLNFGIAVTNVVVRTTVTLTATVGSVSKTAQLVVSPF